MYLECSICGRLSDDGGREIIKDKNNEFLGFGPWKCLDCIDAQLETPKETKKNKKRCKNVDDKML